ncbi:MAG: hypothetical protein JST09_09615 [Bacteroidetes bacterium]|nr:hypothetical protein [Bacteroidota bacterium]
MKIIKRLSLLALAFTITAAGLVLFLWFKPHRNVQAGKVFAEIKARDLVNEFTADAAKANAKYLAADGNSRILIVAGRINKITVNQNGEKVITLKERDEKAGVNATLTQKAGENTGNIKIGDIIKIKGAITAGNSYDTDLDLYEDAVLVECAIVE